MSLVIYKPKNKKNYFEKVEQKRQKKRHEISN